MLVLSQKTGDVLKLGADITISILDVKAGKVRLGISAPAQVKVERQAPTAKPARPKREQ